MTKADIINLLETEYLSGNIDIAEVKRRLNFNPNLSSIYVFTELGIYDEFKKKFKINEEDYQLRKQILLDMELLMVTMIKQKKKLSKQVYKSMVLSILGSLN